MAERTQICGNPDGMAAGELGRLVVRETVFPDGHHLAGEAWASFDVRRVFEPGEGLRDLGPAKVYIHGCCTIAELLEQGKAVG
ncbi:MAG TPA: hypothetical protein VM869_19435 [Enhygromyxa sp.]|nr:hypothetical protein [Enhygromyxa sp.]